MLNHNIYILWYDAPQQTVSIAAAAAERPAALCCGVGRSQPTSVTDQRAATGCREGAVPRLTDRGPGVRDLVVRAPHPYVCSDPEKG